MGTFHDNMGELHGITVVVDTEGSRIAIGRRHEMNAVEIVLMDADIHEEAPGASTKKDFIQRAAQVGVWARHRRLVMPMQGVVSVTPLGQFEG